MSKLSKENFINKKPIKINACSNIQQNSLFYADIETILINRIHQPIALGYTNLTGTISSVTIVNPKSENIKEDFLKILSNFFNSLNNTTVYFHNLSKFDGFFLLKNLYNIAPADQIEFIERYNKIYQIKFKNNLIKDSFILFPESLKKLAITTNKFYSKLNFDYKNITKVWCNKPFVIKMILKNDILCLQESFTILSSIFIINFNVNINSFLTLPSLTLNIYLAQFYENSLIAKNNLYEDKFLRKSYIGGSTDLYKPILKSGFYYDVNSLYPTVMCLDMPLKQGSYSTFNRNKNDNDFLNFFGFLEIKVQTPKKITNPILSKNLGIDGNVCPIGDWTSTYFSEEVKLAKTLGYKIIVIRKFGFIRGKIFKDFIFLFYNIRKLYSKTNPLNKIAKLLLNSLYGRFGMQFVISQKTILPLRNLKSFKTTKIIKSYTSLDLNNCIVDNYSKSFFNNISSNIAVQIAASITSYARVFMFRYKNLPNNLCIYSDTDSVFLTKRLCYKLVNTSLGKFKLVNKVKYAYFISIKSYIYLSDYNYLFVKFKGLDLIEQKKLSIKLFYEKLKSSLTTELSVLKIQRRNYFLRDFTNLAVITQKVLINFKTPFNKRKKVF